MTIYVWQLHDLGSLINPWTNFPTLHAIVLIKLIDTGTACRNSALRRHTGWRKKSPELCVTITVSLFYGKKFPFANLYISRPMYCYLLINFSDVINDAIECRLLT